MGLLANTTSYLVGPVEMVDPSSGGWRDDVENKLKQMGVVIYNPIKKPKWVSNNSKIHPSERMAIINSGSEQADEIISSLVVDREICLRLARSANWCFCNLPKILTYGTIEELHVIKECGSPIIFVCPNGIPSTWILSMFVNDMSEVGTTFFKNVDLACEYLIKIDSGQLPIDPIKWIFLSWNK